MKNIISSIICFTSLLFFLSACTLQTSIDRMGLKKDSLDFSKENLLGDPESLRKFIKNHTMESLTIPEKEINFVVTQTNRWNDKILEGLVQEKLSFPISSEDFSSTDKALFYIFRKGEMQGSKFILWIPGKGMSELAFRFIKYFFKEEIKNNWNILLYIPPYHLERRLIGKKNGEGYFSLDPFHNVKMYVQSIKELRTALHYLEKNKVKKVGAWGGSMGASMMLHLADWQDFDHLCAMIPIVDWNNLFMESKEMHPVRKKLNNSGYSDMLLRDAFSFISPKPLKSNLPDKRRTIFLLAKYDQIASPSAAKEFAHNQGITNIRIYPKSHGTILIEKNMFKDYGKFLSDLR